MTNEKSTVVHQADGGLASNERETLRVALEMGYFEVPRETTLLELSESLGRSDVDVSQELRRGVRAVLRETGVLEHRA